jgi:hypothetical protein
MNAVTHIKVHVYNDGNIELTHIKVTEGRMLINRDLVFSPAEIFHKALHNELLSYGVEENDIEKAVAYILKAQPGESIIVGKV